MTFPIWATSSNLTVSAETEKSYIEFKDQVQRKMDSFIYYFLLIILSGAFISAVLLRVPDLPLILRGITLIFALLLFSLRNFFPKLCNVIFWTFFCVLDYIYSGSYFTFIQQNDIRSFFFAGYMLAIIEIISVSSIAKHRQRLFIQIIFILNKVINFWEYLLENSRVFPYLGILTVVSLYFHFSQEAYNKQNFKTIYESREKLKRFQSLITDDFPVNVLIFPCNLKSIFYFNQCFTQNFFNPTDFQRSEEALNYLFQDLLIESAKKDSKDNNLSISEYLQSFNDSTNQEVHTLLVTYQKVYKKSGYFELKLRKIIWEDQPAYTLILNDISDKYLIEGLKIADEQKDRVIATISHELRTPINGILGLLEMATSRTSDQACLNFLQHCKSCSKLLLYLVNSILDLSQIRHNSLKVHRTRFRLTKVLAEIASLYLFTAQQKNIELIIENQLEDPLLVVETDELKLIEILINLIGNAFKFTFSGYVKLHVKLDPEHQSKILFEIEDTGIGIKDQDKPKLFQMFGKLNHRDQNINTHGVGLGLTISNELVKALNGQDQGEKIHFESVANKGSKFWFRINALSRSSFSINLDQLNRGVLDHRYNQSVSFMRQGTLRTMSNTEITMTEGSRKEKILIVDDNPFNLFTATFIVKKFGFEVDTAGSGQECLRLLDEESQKENSNNNGRVYRMILMDIQMPTMDGIETTQRIKERILKKEMYEIPVVALTAKRIDNRERSLYQEKGLVAALEKPLVAKELAQILKQCL